MRLRNLFWKEAGDLLTTRAFWLLLLAAGPLVGSSFITAVQLYAEMSGAGGGPSALPQGLSPLDGLIVPTFGAYDLMVTLLLPFVAIRSIAAEKESGAWKLLLQGPHSIGTLLAVKGVVLLLGWLLAWLPGLVAVGLWKSYGGAVYAPELLNLLLGHLLRVILSLGVAVAAAAFTHGAASAAIVTLGFTLGTWALDFIGTARGGLLQQLAGYTPTATLRLFEQGLLPAGAGLVCLLLGVGGFALAAAGLKRKQRLAPLLTSTAVLLAAVYGASLLKRSWDCSENQRNSFPPADTQTLQQVAAPLHIRIYLAAEDPRLADWERGILAKLQRTLRQVTVDYAAASRAGLFENRADHYGEIWYEINGKSVMSRTTTEPIVLDALYGLFGIPTPARGGENTFSGHPLVTNPAFAALFYYLLWPSIIAVLGWKSAWS